MSNPVSSFFAAVCRLRIIPRWSLMRNNQREDVQQHSHQVAMFAHGIALVGNQIFGRDYDANKVGMIALYHDAPEVLTGDIPTPIKYYTKEMRDAYKVIETQAEKHLLNMIPEDLRETYCDLVCSDHIDHAHALIVKAADTLSAYIKCIEEINSGNPEFLQAKDSTSVRMNKLREELPEFNYFIETFLPAFSDSLDMQMTSYENAPSSMMSMG